MQCYCTSVEDSINQAAS